MRQRSRVFAPFKPPRTAAKEATNVVVKVPGTKRKLVPKLNEIISIKWHDAFYTARVVSIDASKRKVAVTFPEFDASWDKSYAYDDEKVRWYHGKRPPPLISSVGAAAPKPHRRVVYLHWAYVLCTIK